MASAVAPLELIHHWASLQRPLAALPAAAALQMQPRLLASALSTSGIWSFVRTDGPCNQDTSSRLARSCLVTAFPAVVAMTPS